MSMNRQILTNQPLNVSSVAPAAQVGGQGLIDVKYSVGLAFTGSTCSFTASINVSNDPYVMTAGYVPPNFVPLANSSQAFTQAGTFLYNIDVVGYVWAQLVITDNSSGANNGKVTAVLNVNP